jgi:hypothetical protein
MLEQNIHPKLLAMRKLDDVTLAFWTNVCTEEFNFVIQVNLAMFTKDQ